MHITNSGSLIAVTALRLKSLHLAASSDFVYAKSYLGLLSAVGAMLGIMFCTVPQIPNMIRNRKRIRYRAGSIDSMDRRRRVSLSLSDENLARSLGYRANPSSVQGVPGNHSRITDRKGDGEKPSFSDIHWDAPAQESRTSIAIDPLENSNVGEG